MGPQDRPVATVRADGELDPAQLIACVAQLAQRLQLRIGLGHAVEGLAAKIELAGRFMAWPVNTGAGAIGIEPIVVPVPAAVFAKNIDAIRSANSGHEGVMHARPGMLFV